jgi:hypothetical protein
MLHHAHSIDGWNDTTGSKLHEHLAVFNDLLLNRHTAAHRIQLTIRERAMIARRNVVALAHGSSL